MAMAPFGPIVDVPYFYVKLNAQVETWGYDKNLVTLLPSAETIYVLLYANHIPIDFYFN